MGRKRLKRPSDYPQFAFRLKNEEEKAALDRSINEAVKFYNADLKKNERVYTKKEIILMAMDIGLKNLMAEKGKRS